MARPQKVSETDILTAARHVFLTQGPGVATAEIARAVGVSTATLFHRYGSKRALMIAALRPDVPDSLLARLNDGPQSTHARAELESLAMAIATLTEDAGPAIATLRAAGVRRSDVFPDADSSPLTRLTDAVARWFTLAQRAGLLVSVDPGATADLLIRGLHSRPFDHQPPTSRVPGVVRALWTGLAPGASR